MRKGWIGITGALMIVAAIALSALGPRLLPSVFAAGAYPGMMNGAMMNGAMMNGAMSGTMERDMMNGVASDPTQPYDRRFLDEMIVHHEQGVLMTQHMIVDSSRAELRDLAQRIITAQQREIVQMRQWRSDWYGTASDDPREAMMEQTPGMGMNRGAMQQMMGSQVDIDRMFLQMMIPHHQAAITMAQQALTTAEHAEIKTLAQNIITTQQAEIEEMQRYLNQWYSR